MRAHAYDYASSDYVTVTVEAKTKRAAEPITFELVSQKPQSGSSAGKPEEHVEGSDTHRKDGFVRDPSYTYHHYDDLKSFLAFYAHTYPNITR